MKKIIIYTSLVFIIIFIAILYIISNMNIGNSSRLGHDYYAYHAGLIKLNNTYPAIKGMILLRHVLTLIQASSFQASFFAPYLPTVIMSPYLSLISIVTMFSACVLSIFILIKHILQKKLFSSFFTIFLFTFLIALLLVFSSSLPDRMTNQFYNHDYAVYISTCMLLIYLFYFLHNPTKNNLFMCMMLSILSIFIKLSALPIVLIVASIVTIYWFIKTKKQSYVYFLFIVISCFIFSPFIVQNIIRSGALVFPITFTDLNLPWGDKNIMIELRHLVTGLARAAGVNWQNYRDIVDNLHWVPTWFSVRRSFLIYYFSFYSFLSVGFFLYIARSNIFKKESLMFYTTSSIINILLMIYWFLLSPDPRFSGVIFMLPIILITSLILIQMFFKNSFQNIYATIILCIVIIFPPLHLSMSLSDKKYSSMFFLIIMLALSVIFYSFFHTIKNTATSLKHYGINIHLKYHKTVNKIIKTPLFYVIFFSFLLLLHTNADAGKRLDYINTDEYLESFEYNGVTLYKSKRDNDMDCAYTDKLPCVAGRPTNSNVTWIDPQQWWKGVIKREFKK